MGYHRVSAHVQLQEAIKRSFNRARCYPSADWRAVSVWMFCVVGAMLVCAPFRAFAQDVDASASESPASIPVSVAAFDGAPPPTLPATISRDAEGRTTVRAVRLRAPLRLDGGLDEDIYRTVTPISDFIQAEPAPGAPATEKTEVWMSFDDDNVYVSVRAFESQPERMVVNEMRRDSNNIVQNENFLFAFDTLLRPAQQRRLSVQPDRRAHGRAGHQREPATTATGTRCGACRSGGSTTAGPPRPRCRSSRCATEPGAGADLGLPEPPHQPLEERDVLPDAACPTARAPRLSARLGVRHAGRARGAARHRARSTSSPT